MSAQPPQRVNRTYDQLDVGDVVFCHNSMSFDAIRYLGITSARSNRSMRTRIHPTIILHKNDANHTMTGVTVTSKPMSQISSNRQEYFVNASDYASGQTGVINIAGLNTIDAAGNPPPTVCCAIKLNP